MNLLFWMVLGMLGHEVAHYLTARQLGLNARFFVRKCVVGVKYWVGDGETVRVSRRDRVLVSAAGPLFNIAVGLLFPSSRLVMLVLVATNLLPIKGSDGYNIIRK